MEEKIVQQAPVSENYEERIHEVAEANRQKLIDDFDNGVLHLRNYAGVSKFKSIRRAIKRGHVSMFGDIYPRRPYNNRKSHKNSVNAYKRKIYEQLIH